MCVCLWVGQGAGCGAFPLLMSVDGMRLEFELQLYIYYLPKCVFMALGSCI